MHDTEDLEVVGHCHDPGKTRPEVVNRCDSRFMTGFKPEFVTGHITLFMTELMMVFMTVSITVVN